MKKILVVDDDAVVQKLLGETLERKGYKVTIAKDGIDAMILVRKDRPDLVVLDIMMPNLNGYEVCRKIKQDKVLKSIPIILLTSRGEEVDPRLLQLMGIEYLHKTAKPQELLDMLEKSVGH